MKKRQKVVVNVVFFVVNFYWILGGFMYDVKKNLLPKINNTGYKIKINYKVVNGKFVLYMKYRKMIDGITKEQAKHLVTLTGTDKTKDLMLLNQAMKFRDEYESTMKPNTNVFKKAGDRIYLVNYIEQHANRYQNRSAMIFTSVKNHIIACFGSHTLLSQVDKAFVMKFMEYLPERLPQSAYNVFKKFKQVLYRAIDEEIISDLPFLRRLHIKHPETTREFLNEEEIKSIMNLEYRRPEIKNAFLFSCYTGLRFVDLHQIKFSDIENDRLYIRQQKTGRDHTMKLHPIAVKIVENQKQNGSEFIFPMSYSEWRKNVKDMMKKAKISKDITGHCARHTFGTRIYRATKDIYVASKLLGHSNVSTTQIYAKMVDEDKDNAIDKLGSIDFEANANGLK